LLNLEIIVVDDGSTDQTCACVQRFGDRVRYLRMPNSGGAALPRNHGIAAATGSIFSFIDADDLPEPEKIASEVAFLQEYPDVGLVFSNYRDLFAEGTIGQDHFSTCPGLSHLLATAGQEEPRIVLPPHLSTELLLTENFGSSAPTVRRSVIDRVGCFDQTAIPSEDFEFEYRVAAAGPIGVINTVGWLKRSHAHNLSSNTVRVLQRKIDVRHRLLREQTDMGRRRKLERMLATYHLDLAHYYTGKDNCAAVRELVRATRWSHEPHLRKWARIAVGVFRS